VVSQTGYNIVKEGDLYNSEIATYFVSVSGLRFLYVNPSEAVSFVVPQGRVSSLDIVFGEYFDIDNIKCYLSPINLGDISISYGIESPLESSATISSSGTFIYADIKNAVGFCRITCSGSVDTSVSSLFVEGVRNESMYFGVQNAPISITSIGNSPIGYYGSASEISIYNKDKASSKALVAVAPTGTYIDEYLYLGTTSSGQFYGINQLGITQPSFDKILTTQDSFVYSDESGLVNLWDIVSTSSSYFTVNSDSLSFVASFINADIHVARPAHGYNESSVLGLVCKDTFTTDQSFVASLKIKFTDSSFDSYDKSWVYKPNKFLFGFTNSFPIQEPLLSYSSLDQGSYSRQGGSLAAVWVGADNKEQGTLYVGAAANDGDFSSNNILSSFDEVRTVHNGHSILSAYSLESISEFVLYEENYTDGTLQAPWRTLKVSYDHLSGKAVFLFDGVIVGEYVFSSGSFFEGSRFFLSFVGFGGAEVAVKDFFVSVDEYLTLYSNQSSATAYGSKDSTQLPYKLVDGFYDNSNYSSAWVSSTVPSPANSFSVYFGGVYNVEAVRIKRASEGSTITISGLSSYTPTSSVKTLQLNFDTGDQRYVSFNKEPFLIDGWDIGYMYTVFGERSPVLGASSVTANFYQVNSLSGNTGCLVIDEVEFFTVSGIRSLPSSSYIDDSYGFFSGQKRNLSKTSTSPTMVMVSKDLYDVSTNEMCHLLLENRDYGGSSLVFNNDDPWKYINRTYAESVFKRDGRGSEWVFCSVEGNTAYIWRQFEEVVDLGAFFVNFVNSSSDYGLGFSGRPDSWKLQFLRIGGDPLTDSDWINIPPVSTSYHSVSDYKTYRDRLVSNNDGEYYTLYLNAFDGLGTSVSLPSDLLCRLNRDNKQTYLYSTSAEFSAYVEFDSEIRTQGIRLYISYGYTTTSRAVVASGYSMTGFVVYSSMAVGSYTSPIFDLGGKQNTERVFVDTVHNEGSSYIMYRAGPVPPEYSYDPNYEEWEDLGSSYAGLSEYSSDPLRDGFAMVSYGNYICFIGCTSPDGEVYRYNTITKKWGVGFYMPEDGGGVVLSPDFRTRNSVVNTGSVILMAEGTDGGEGLYTSGIYKYNLVANEYGYDGWEAFPSQRQASAYYAGMAYDGANKLYFVGRDGTITVFDSLTGVINTEGRAEAPLHGLSSRDYFIPTIVENRLFVIGGHAVGSSDYSDSVATVDIYDITNNTWSEGTSAPYKLPTSWCIFYSPYIYVFPYAPMGSHYSPFLKYDIYADEWTEVVSLGYNRATQFLYNNDVVVGNNHSHAYCLCGDYIYGYNSLYGDFRRVKVGKEGWVSGKLPDKDSHEWGVLGGIPWVECAISGEVMPQDRYAQYKAVLSCEEGLPGPSLRSSCIVKPLSIDVSISGTTSVFVKTGVSTEYDAEVWYAGKRYRDVGSTTVYSSIIYGITSDSLSISSSVPCVDIHTDTISGVFCYFDPCVVKEGDDYTMWASHGLVNGVATISYSNIHVMSSVVGYEWSSPVHSIGRGTLSPYDSSGVYGPHVVHNDIYEVWYTALDSLGVERVLRATSIDGVNWYNFSLVQDIGTVGLQYEADSNGAGSPSVILLESIYHMWYHGKDVYGVYRIIHCVSSDGVLWGDHEVVMVPTSMGTLYTYCMSPRVVYDRGVYKMWVIAGNEGNKSVYYGESDEGSSWGSFICSIHKGENYDYDNLGVGTPSVTLNRLYETPNRVLFGKLKLYND